MTLLSGTRLGAYEILGALGAGGMGEVYRARDMKLGRDVALKILPDTFANDPERLARFEREARVLASLNHPNIAAIHGLEETGGMTALVMELVEGDDLSQRIARGAIPIDDALPIARQIAEALESAHEQGIIHRDLKPANIKVRSDGTVKVLDFGLAKLAQASGYGLQASGTDALSQAPTITSPAMMTGVGMILGTAAYMAPEQARGKTVDKRADIWAFGAVLFEMLTGTRAFPGEDITDTLAAVVKSDPAWDTFSADVPARVRQVLRACLQKDPKQRLGDMQSVRLALEGAFETPAPTGPAEPGPIDAPSRARERLVWVGGALALAALAAAGTYATRPAPAAQAARFQIYPPGKSSFAGTGIAVSPDGATLAFLATGPSGVGMLWVRPVDSFEARPLPGTEGARAPFWSPDSRSIGYFTSGALKRIDTTGGPSITICTTGLGTGGTWNRDGLILFSAQGQTVLRVAAGGGQPVPVTTLNAGRKEAIHRWPSFLPDGRHFLYSVSAASPDAGGIYVGSIESSDATRLVASDSFALYAPPGVLLLMRGGTLLQQRFDAGRLSVQGDATPLTERVAGFSASANGVLAFRSVGQATTQFTWFDRSGRVVNTVGPPGSYRHPALSPDETRLAFVRLDDQGVNDLWLLDLSRSVMSRFTFNPGNEEFPTWSPDGTRILYASDQLGGARALFEKNASGTGAEALVLKPAGLGPLPWQVSRDGKLLLYMEAVPRSGFDIFTLPLAASGAGPAVEGQKPRPIVQTTFTDVEPMLSPDGRWLAYVSDETGRQEVYVQPFPPSGGKWQISSGGADVPTWRGDGKEIFFVSADRKLYAVDVHAGATFEYGVPHALFDVRVDVGGGTKTNVISSHDGQRFLVNQLVDTAASPINVVLNWQAGGKP